MAKKPIPILHPTPKADKPFAILPIGLFCNDKLQKAAVGSLVEFWQDWRHDKRVLVRKCKVQIKSSVFTFLLRSIYGENMTITKLMERWEAWAVVEGIGKEGFDRDYALIVETTPLEE